MVEIPFNVNDVTKIVLTQDAVFRYDRGNTKQSLASGRGSEVGCSNMIGKERCRAD